MPVLPKHRTRAYLFLLSNNYDRITSVVLAQTNCAPVAQLDRASACGAEGRRFESCRVYQWSVDDFCHRSTTFIFVSTRFYDSTACWR